jgi:hypothetical protein
VARVGRVDETADPARPYRLLGADGVEVAAVTEFLHDMLADDASPTSLRSYAYELLAWFRFLRAVDVPWDRASRTEARGFRTLAEDDEKATAASPPGCPCGWGGQLGDWQGISR